MQKIFLLLFFFSFNASAALLKIDSLVHIESEKIKGSFNSIENLNAFYIQPQDDKNSRITVVYRKAPTMANLPGLERIWKKDLLQNKKQKVEIVKNFGCKKIMATQYGCEKSIKINNEYSYYKLIWNRDQNLIFINSSHHLNLDQAIAFGDSFKIIDQAKNRYLAGVVK